MKKQLELINKPVLFHGGDHAIGKRKIKRPLDTRKPIHVTLRSEVAKGDLALVNHHNQILKLLRKWAEKYKISIYETNINFNHIHLLIRGKKRGDLQNFFRVFTALAARVITGAKKGKPFGKFWGSIIFTRLLSSWGREFWNARDYIIKNTLETLGLIPHIRDKKIKAQISPSKNLRLLGALDPSEFYKPEKIV